MKKIKLISVLLVSVVALTACGGSGGKVTNLNVSEFATKISDSSVTLVDVRTPGEFMSGHITGATNIDFESGTFEADIQKLDKSKIYAVYCRSGNRSGQATALMAKDGFKAVFNLNGGVIDWTGAGQALVTN
jgi:rhodanese-related sulfurtransferase